MSLTPQQQTMIDAEITIWMDAERMFTAFEISRALKAKGIGLRHGQMKSEIHSTISRKRLRTYTRSLADVGAPQQAWVYHPTNKNPDNFQSLNEDPPGATSAPVVAAAPSLPTSMNPSAPTPQSQSQAKTISLSCDSDGHLTIPKAELEPLGINPSQSLHVVSNSDDQSLKIGLVGSMDGDSPEAISTRPNGDLLIEHEMLEFIDLDWLPRYRVTFDEGEKSIEVSG